MNNTTINKIDDARAHLARGEIDSVEKVIRGLPPEVVCGNVFDRKNFSINKDTIALILYGARTKKGIKRIKHEGDLHLRINELKNIFDSLENNLNLFDLKFKNRVHKLNINDKKSIIVSVGMCNLFHLLGFDFFNWQNRYKEEILRIFPEFAKLLELDYIEICSNDDRIFYDALHIILSKKEKIIDELMTGDKAVLNAYNIKKVKTKNYLFEKADYTSSPSGVIGYIPKETKLKGDLFILRDFINWDVQDWSYFSFVNHGCNPYKSSESLLLNFVPKDTLDLSKIAYTTSVETLNKELFLKGKTEDAIISKTTFSKYEIAYVKSKIYGR